MVYYQDFTADSRVWHKVIGGPQKAAIGDDLWVLSMLKKGTPHQNIQQRRTQYPSLKVITEVSCEGGFQDCCNGKKGSPQGANQRSVSKTWMWNETLWLTRTHALTQTNKQKNNSRVLFFGKPASASSKRKLVWRRRQCRHVYRLPMCCLLILENSVMADSITWPPTIELHLTAEHEIRELAARKL